ncbi:hypothetical protein [Actinomadura rugatobispora]|uniref:Protein kinase domain-containing protein n=1 Tax=Actinomadura rugatobispora TaxID=1994 RepID=A0ABW0ZVT5_9ACTN
MSRETSHREHIGPYRLLDRVGGGVGVVHRAADPGGRDVAIRVLPPGTYDVAAMREVRSPYVVDVLDGAGDGDRPYVVSRFVPGRPLDEWLTAPLEGAGLHRMALGLAKAVAAIHRAGLTHGDLRPDHVLVVDGAPVVIDFALVPGEPARDLRAWAATVAFAATADARCLTAPDPVAVAGEAIPEALRPLLEAASGELATGDAAAEEQGGAPLTAERLADEVAALKPVLAEGARTSAPAPAAPSSAASPVREAAPPVPAPTAPNAAPTPGQDRREAHELAVARAWSRLLTAMVVVIAVGIAIAMPLAGIALSLAAVTVLRAGSDGAARAVGGAALGVVCAAPVAVLVTLGLAAISLLGVEVDPLGACAFGAGAAVGVLWAVPGARGPRRRLEEAFASVVRGPGRIVPAGIVLGVLALGAVVAAISLTPSLAPMYGLQSTLESSVARFQHAIQ